MRQVLRKGFSTIVVEEVPDPALLPHHVLIRPAWSLISSGTETASIHQEGVVRGVARNPSQLATVVDAVKAVGPARTLAEMLAKLDEYAVLGYAGAGTVVDKHPTVSDVGIGARVAYGGEGTGHAETVLAARNLVAPVPDAVPYEHACFATPGAIAMNAVRTAHIGLGDVVVVLGLGLIGQLIAQLARLQGGVVVGVDIKGDRVELARRLGAHYVVASGAGPEHAVRTLTGGRGADCVIVAAAASSATPCRQALQMCRDRGRLIIVGAVELSFPWPEMYRKEIQVFMSRAYGPGSYDPDYEKRARDYPVAYVRWTEHRNMEEFLRLLALGELQLAPLITHRFPLEDAAAAYGTILDPASGSLAVLLGYSASAHASREADFHPRRKIDVTSAPDRPSHIQVAVIGAGNLARWIHLPNLRRVSGVTLRAVCSASGARGKSYARRFRAAYCCSDYSEVLRDPEVDTVMIVSRNEHHGTQALQALHAGKHVFVEKPLALTEAECRLLTEAVAETGRHLTVGFNRRFAPFYLRQKALLRARTGPAVINCRVNSPAISGSYWMADPASGGAILGEACHFVDLMYWLLESEPVAVTAYCLPAGSRDPIGENNLVASVQFADGSIGNLTYCTVGSRWSAGERVETFAAGMAVTVENFKRLTLLTAVGRRHYMLWADKGYAAQLDAFFAGIRGGAAPAVTVHDGVRATIVCLRMLESARTHRPARIEW
jgi:predicted dehydrogenase/threonine dehydrogenase-like Zn-dependent dehydrogenase